MRKKRAKPKKAVKTPKMAVTESPDYRVSYASGVFGGLDPHDGRMIFFLDRLRPKMKKGGKGSMMLDRIDRELQVEIHMSPAQFISAAKWMNDHAQKFRKNVKTKKKESATSYIG